MHLVIRIAAALVLTSSVVMAPPVSATWYEARTNHFLVYAESREKTARDMAVRLEQFDQGMRKLRGLKDVATDRSNPLIVYVVPDLAAVQHLCNTGGQRNQTGCAHVAGFYNARVGNSVAYTPMRSGSGDPLDLNAQTILFHEYTHHFMFENFPGAYPAWFSEGFAEFNSTAELKPDSHIGFGLPALHRLYVLRQGPKLPMETLLAPDGHKLNAERIEAFYGRGWLLTHYLTMEKSREGQLAAYLTAIAHGKDSLEAGKAAFGNLKKLDGELDSYISRKSLNYFSFDLPPLADNAITIRTLGEGESAMMPVRMRSKTGVDNAAAQRIVVDARRVAAPFSADPVVQGALAEAEFDAGNDDLAEAAAGRALAANANDRVALLYKGQIHVRRAMKAHSTDPVVWKEARSWFVRANKLDADYAEPLALYYMSFFQAAQEPSRNAVIALERAFELSPQDQGLRLLYARQEILDDHLKEARAALAVLAYDPHSPPDNFASKLIDLIDKGDKAMLRSLLEHGLGEDKPLAS